MVSLMVILFSTKCFLFVYMYIDLLKHKAYKLLENSDAGVSKVLFLKKPTCTTPNSLKGTTWREVIITLTRTAKFCEICIPT